ncbi:hypothetical protein B0H10DRAFT_2172619 [Mycena sp. CBHHK59/15]|nr:hypothetical protein B0H10DRAFT_2172619 [Mycena sp. CBHHK59/15]
MAPIVATRPSVAQPQSVSATIYCSSLMTPPPLASQQPLQSPAQLRSPARSLSSAPQRRRTARSRRRHCPRAECHVESTLHAFDTLPWISALDSPPDPLNPWDFADLSQIDVEEPPSRCGDPMNGELSPCSGPIRRRKTSLRSNPLAPRSPNLHDLSFHTPSPHNHSRVLFHNLMPVFSCDHALNTRTAER